jgi:CubicO group peptidase (beta-lactamase class C family)
MTPRLFVLSLSLFCSLSASAEETLRSSAIQAASRYSTAQHATALIVVQHGKTLLREFPGGAGPSEPVRIYSGTKFFWCLAALVAQDKGILKLDERVSETIPSWQESKAKQNITLRQLLNFTSGLPAMDELHQDGVSNRDTLAVRHELAVSPGSRFIYGPASLQVFHEVLRKKLEKKGDDPTRFLERQVLKPMGLGPQRYVPDRAGNPLLAAGFKLTADDWLRMGRLILHGGKPVTSSASIAQAFNGTEANPAFGLGLWNNRRAGTGQEVNVQKLLESKWQTQDWHGACLCDSAPKDLVASIGSHGQRIYVVPSMDLIVVRQGERSEFSDRAFLRLLFAK